MEGHGRRCLNCDAKWFVSCVQAASRRMSSCGNAPTGLEALTPSMVWLFSIIQPPSDTLLFR